MPRRCCRAPCPRIDPPPGEHERLASHWRHSSARRKRGLPMTDVQASHRVRIPRDKEHDYTDEMAHKRQAFVSEFTGAGMEHVSKYSFDPGVLPGNIENFV